MTTTNHKQIDLPKIPSLPPLEMPDASSFLGPSDFTDSHTRSSPLHPSSVSVASQDTFMTAHSAMYSDLNATPTTASPDLLSPVSPVSAGPLPGLRKSISVDSFIKYRPPSDSSTRQVRGNTVSTTTKPLMGRDIRGSRPSTDSRPEVTSYGASSSGTGRDSDARAFQQAEPGPSRSRGASFSTTTTVDEQGDTYYDESDMERSEDLINVARKGKSKFKRPGDLSLPSRLQTASSSPTMGKTPPPIVPERISSLGRPLKKQRSLISVNTHLPSTPHAPPGITIAVLGTKGAGKSTVIRKGLKAFGIAESAGTTTTSVIGGTTLRYVYRVGRLPHKQADDSILRVLEVDILTLDLSPGGSIFPDGVPQIDGLIFCYDASEAQSFEYVKMGLNSVAHLSKPAIVFGCKSDMDREVEPNEVHAFIDQYDVGLIEATVTNDFGKAKIRDGFEWVFKAILDPMRGRGRDQDLYWNPASPSVLTAPPLESSRASSATPTAGAHHSSLLSSQRTHSSRLASGSQESPRAPLSPNRTRSMSDLLSSERERDRESHGYGKTANNVLGISGPESRTSSHTGLSGPEHIGSSFDDANDPNRSIASRDSRPPRWLTLEELLDKLLFVAVSEDDPTFISHFLLTYRRFAIPRSVLLAMQKRMRALDQSNGDPMFACYAQMKICWLLDRWIQLYPSDFAVPGTSGALSALIKSIVGKTYLLHYGSIFIPFLETLPKLKDQDTSWAMKGDVFKYDSDDSSSIADLQNTTPASPASSNTSQSLHDSIRLPSPATTTAPAVTTNVTRERKPSLPLTAKMLLSNSSPTQPSSTEMSWGRKVKYLLNVSQQVHAVDQTNIAQEITRIESQYFLEIQPRHWLQHVIGRGEKDPKADTIGRYNTVSHHIANWVVSLILCQDKAKARARMIQYFVELAVRLRNMNNYSALRAVIAGINSAAFETDASMLMYRNKPNSNFKIFQSYDHLLQAVRAHGKYRLALRNSKGACIPALEIHLSDLIRAHEGNSDFHDDDPNHIHWEKWNMMGRFIDGIAQCQQACRETRKYDETPVDNRARELLLLEKPSHLMDPDQQNERILQDKMEGIREDRDDYIEEPRPAIPRQPSREPGSHAKEKEGGGRIQKLFFW